jgi:hypothetical protein
MLVLSTLPWEHPIQDLPWDVIGPGWLWLVGLAATAWAAVQAIRAGVVTWRSVVLAVGVYGVIAGGLFIEIAAGISERRVERLAAGDLTALPWEFYMGLAAAFLAVAPFFTVPLTIHRARHR